MDRLAPRFKVSTRHFASHLRRSPITFDQFRRACKGELSLSAADQGTELFPTTGAGDPAGLDGQPVADETEVRAPGGQRISSSADYYLAAQALAQDHKVVTHEI